MVCFLSHFVLFVVSFVHYSVGIISFPIVTPLVPLAHARTMTRGGGGLATFIRFHGDQKAVSVITQITVLSAFVFHFPDLCAGADCAFWRVGCTVAQPASQPASITGALQK